MRNKRERRDLGLDAEEYKENKKAKALRLRIL
jgi:hypothetical protein